MNDCLVCWFLSCFVHLCGILIVFYLMSYTQGQLHEALDQYDEIMEEDENDFRPYLCQV